MIITFSVTIIKKISKKTTLRERKLNQFLATAGDIKFSFVNSHQPVSEGKHKQLSSFSSHYSEHLEFYNAVSQLVRLIVVVQFTTVKPPVIYLVTVVRCSDGVSVGSCVSASSKRQRRISAQPKLRGGCRSESGTGGKARGSRDELLSLTPWVK